MDRHGVRPDPEAVEAVLTWKAPRTDTQLVKNGGQAWCEARSGSSRGCVDMEGSENGHRLLSRT